jgi:hypothetical protein
MNGPVRWGRGKPNGEEIAMLRTAFLSAAAALVLALPAASTARAHPPVVPFPTTGVHHARPGHPSHYPPAPILPGPTYRTWKVLYRDCDHEPWRVYRVYRDDDDAYRTARYLRRTGHEARVVFDRGPVY